MAMGDAVAKRVKAPSWMTTEDVKQDAIEVLLQLYESYGNHSRLIQLTEGRLNRRYQKLFDKDSRVDITPIDPLEYRFVLKGKDAISESFEHAKDAYTEFILQFLTPRKADIVCMYCGLPKYSVSYSSTEIACKYHISPSMVNQIIRKAKSHLQEVIEYPIRPDWPEDVKRIISDYTAMEYILSLLSDRVDEFKLNFYARISESI